MPEAPFQTMSGPQHRRSQGCTGCTCTPGSKEKMGERNLQGVHPLAEVHPQIEQESHFRKSWGALQDGSG